MSNLIDKRQALSYAIMVALVLNIAFGAIAMWQPLPEAAAVDQASRSANTSFTSLQTGKWSKVYVDTAGTSTYFVDANGGNFKAVKVLNSDGSITQSITSALPSPATTVTTITGSSTKNDILFLQGNGGTGQNLNTGATTIIAEKVATSSSELVGQVVNEVHVWMKFTTTVPASSTITVAVMSSVGSTLYSFGTMDASTLTSSFVEYTFTGTSTGRTLASGDYIGVFYNAGDATHLVTVEYNNADIYDGATNTIAATCTGLQGAAVCSDQTARELHMQLGFKYQASLANDNDGGVSYWENAGYVVRATQSDSTTTNALTSVGNSATPTTVMALEKKTTSSLIAGVSVDQVKLRLSKTGSPTGTISVVEVSATGSTANPLNQATGTLTANVMNDVNSGYGEHLNSGAALIGTTVNSMTIGLKKTNSPTGTLSACVMSSAGACTYTFGTVDVSQLTTSDAAYSFTNYAASKVLALNEYIGVKYTGGTSSNTVTVEGSSANAYDTTLSAKAVLSAALSWAADTTTDLGSSTANTNFRLYTVVAPTVLNTFNTMSAASLTTTEAVYTFTAATDFTLSSGATTYIGVLFTGGDVGSTVNVARTAVDVYDGIANSVFSLWTNGAFSDTTTADLRFRLIDTASEAGDQESGSFLKADFGSSLSTSGMGVYWVSPPGGSYQRATTTSASSTSTGDNLMAQTLSDQYWCVKNTSGDTCSGGYDTTTNTYGGIYIADTSSAIYGKAINKVTLSLANPNAMVGTLAVGVLSSTGTMQCTIASLAASGIAVGQATYTFTKASGYCDVSSTNIIGIDCGACDDGGSISKSVRVYTQSGTPFDSTHTSTKRGATIDTSDTYSTVTFVPASSYSADNHSTTYWKNGSDSEANAYLCFDFGSSQTYNSLRLTFFKTTEVPQTVALKASTISCTASLSTITSISPSAVTTQQTFGFTDTALRYLRLEVTTYGSATRMSINEGSALVVTTTYKVPSTFKLSYSTDDVSYTDLETYSTLLTAPGLEYIEFDQTYTARYVKITSVTWGSSAFSMAIGELQRTPAISAVKITSVESLDGTNTVFYVGTQSGTTKTLGQINIDTGETITPVAVTSTSATDYGCMTATANNVYMAYGTGALGSIRIDSATRAFGGFTTVTSSDLGTAGTTIVSCASVTDGATGATDVTYWGLELTSPAQTELYKLTGTGTIAVLGTITGDPATELLMENIADKVITRATASGTERTVTITKSTGTVSAVLYTSDWITYNQQQFDFDGASRTFKSVAKVYLATSTYAIAYDGSDGILRDPDTCYVKTITKAGGLGTVTCENDTAWYRISDSFILTGDGTTSWAPTILSGTMISPTMYQEALDVPLAEDTSVFNDDVLRIACDVLVTFPHAHDLLIDNDDDCTQYNLLDLSTGDVGREYPYTTSQTLVHTDDYSLYNIHVSLTTGDSQDYYARVTYLGTTIDQNYFDTTDNVQLRLLYGQCYTLDYVEVLTSDVANTSTICADDVAFKEDFINISLGFTFWSAPWGGFHTYNHTSHILTTLVHHTPVSYNYTVNVINGTDSIIVDQDFNSVATTTDSQSFNLTSYYTETPLKVVFYNEDGKIFYHDTIDFGGKYLETWASDFDNAFGTFGGFSILMFLPIIFAAIFTRSTAGLGGGMLIAFFAVMSFLGVIQLDDGVMVLITFVGIVGILAYRVLYQ